MSVRHRLLAWSPCVVAFALAACSTEAEGASRRLVLTGSSTVAPLALELAKRFEQTVPGTRVDVQTGGSSRGITDARSGAADLGMVSRKLDASESDLKGHVIARDGIAVIVHRSNPVSEIDTDTLRAIYRGDTTRWSSLSPVASEITVVHKADGRATQAVFLAHLGMRPSEVVPDVVIGENAQGIKTVAGLRSAIGYVSIGAALAAVEDGVSIRLLSLDGVEASYDNLRRGVYPIARELLFVTRGAATGRNLEFLEFARSERVHDLVRAAAFVPLSP